MRILVINDDIEKADLFELLVECYPLEVTSIRIGEDSVTKVDQFNPDVIVFDTFSPNDRNISFCTQIRESTSSPILMASVIGNPDLVAKALNAGADDLMIKPISKTLLLARLNGLIARSRGENNYFGRISIPFHSS